MNKITAAEFVAAATEQGWQHVPSTDSTLLEFRRDDAQFGVAGMAIEVLSDGTLFASSEWAQDVLRAIQA